MGWARERRIIIIIQWGRSNCCCWLVDCWLLFLLLLVSVAVHVEADEIDWLIGGWLVGWVCGGYNNLMEEIWLELYYTYLRIILSMCVCYSQEVIYFWENNNIYNHTHAHKYRRTRWELSKLSGERIFKKVTKARENRQEQEQKHRTRKRIVLIVIQLFRVRSQLLL